MVEKTPEMQSRIQVAANSACESEESSSLKSGTYLFLSTTAVVIMTPKEPITNHLRRVAQNGTKC